MLNTSKPSDDEKAKAIETTETLKTITKPDASTPEISNQVPFKKPNSKKKKVDNSELQQVKAPKIETQESKPEIEETDSENVKADKNDFGRQDEFLELNSTGSVSSGNMKRNSAQEVAGLGCIFKSEVFENGLFRESLVFVPGASIIDLYEDHENPNVLSGRTLAKR